MMNSKVLCLALAVALVALACVASAQDTSSTTTTATPNPNCPVQMTKNFMSNLMDSIRSMTSSATSAVSDATSTGDQAPTSLARRKRQATADDPAPLAQPTPQEVAAFNENIKNEESQLHSLISSIANSPYMPSREQMIDMLTTVLTLLLMMLIGPVLGSNYGMVQTIVKQIVPFLVTAGVHYAADQALPGKQLDTDITQVQLSPVQSSSQSTTGQTI